MRVLSAREQLEIIKSNVVDLVTPEDLLLKLERSVQTGKPLVIKYGADPSRPDIHLGHVVCLLKMRQFQDLGHEVVFVIGDFTARIGDPTGRSQVRPPLSREEVEENARTYHEQVTKVLDPEKMRVVYNSHWLEPLSLKDLVKIAGKFTVAQMLEREDFQNRYQNGIPIYLHEFLYALMVAYDSVALNCDVEMGGQDQLFNFLVGRDLMREMGQEPQVCLTMPILEGTDGVQKMSKSLGNDIPITDPPQEMFGRVMSIPDNVMSHYFLYLNLATPQEVKSIEERMASGSLNPRDVKLDLATRIVSWLHSPGKAKKARQEFEKVFSRGGMPEEMPEKNVSLPLDLLTFLVDVGLVPTKSEARRLLKQGGIYLDNVPLPYSERPIISTLEDGAILRVGKKRFIRLRLT